MARALNGVFVSYSRDDQPVARRVRNGLDALGIDVLWDESMPGVDWQEFLEESIDKILAVVVLWTPRSCRSGSVRDEARLGLDKGKLVNLLHGVDKPRFPYDRINGLAIDDWVAGTPHSGWARLASTLDDRLAAAGAIARPGMVTAVLGQQLKAASDRRAALAGLGRKRERALHDFDGKQRLLTRAEEGVAAALVQLDHLRAISPSKAVMNAAFADRDEANAKLARAASEVALARAAADNVAEALGQADSDLRDYLISIGGKSEAETEDIPALPRQVEPDPADAPPLAAGGSLAVEPAEEPVPEVDEAESGYGPRASPVAGGEIPAEPSSETIGTGDDPADRSPRPAPRTWYRALLDRPFLTVFAMIFLIAVAGASLAVAIWPRGPDGSAGPAVAASPPREVQAPPTPPDNPTKPSWILGDWVVDADRLGCRNRVNISYSDDGDIEFKGSDGSTDKVYYAVRSFTPPVIETGQRHYEQLSSGRIKVTERGSGNLMELSRCKS